MTKLPSDSSCGNRQQDGMTLIEILVAIVVLSIGLLGLAGLQLKGLQVGQGSTYRWQAAMLAEDIADRMRADRANALSGLYQLPGGTPSGATAQTISEWQTRLAALPQGAATITAPTAAPVNEVTITISWTDTRANAGAGGTGTTQGFYQLMTEL
jgi:type IV pilus assembly protein PilV